MSGNICPNCGAANKPQAHFCASCGHQLHPDQPAGSPDNCPQCGIPLRPGSQFCPSCGFSLSAAAPGATVAAGPQAAPMAPGVPGDRTQLIDKSDTPPTLAVTWMGGQVEKHQVTKPSFTIGRAPDSDLVINHPAVSGHHLRLDTGPAGYTVTDLNSTNGTQVNGQLIPSGAPHPILVEDVLRIGDLTGNSVSLKIESPEGESLRTLSLGSLDLTTQRDITIGRDPNSYLPLNHPTVSFRHAVISKQNGTEVVRDLGSTNGTFVNGSRISHVPLSSGDVIQIGPFKLVYDAQQQSLAQSMRLGHRLDAVNLGREVGKGKMILDDVSISVQPGDFVSLVGGSGAGKSTLLKALNGFEPANHGQMLIDGEALYSRIDMYRTQMGYVPQDDIIHRELPVRLALWYAAKLRMPDATAAEIDVRINEALEAVDMTAHQDKPVRVLSGGQRKRVSIAVELLARPTLFFLDEPTSGLDPGLEKKMMYDLNRLADEGRTVVLVTHATTNIDQCNYVSFLAFGKTAYFGPPNEAISFFGVQDFADIYLKLSQEIDPTQGKPAPPELQPYYQQHASTDGSTVMSGTLYADHFRQSPQYQKYVTDRQRNLITGGQIGSAPVVKPAKRARDNAFRQTYYLARRMFDLIRFDKRTLFILLLMMPLIALLFVAVSGKNDLTGRVSTINIKYEDTEEGRDVDIELTEKENVQDAVIDVLEGEAVGAKAEYIPVVPAQTLTTMLALAMTQGGTFAAAYEIVKEGAIFKRERAINLKVSSYVTSKVLVLGVFALFQVASVLLLLYIGLDVDFEGVPIEIGGLTIDSAMLQLYITLVLAVLASICFGLFISAIVPNTDVVLYVILIQLFVQIILAGTLFPMEANIASRLTIGNWAMDAMGSIVDLPELNEQGRGCSMVEIPVIPDMSSPEPPPSSGETTLEVNCQPIIQDLPLDYEHTWEHLAFTWAGLLAHTIGWGALTMLVLVRKKG